MGYCGYWLKHIIGYFFSALSAFTSCTLSMVAEPSFFLSEPAKLTESTPSPITTTRLFSLSIATEITPVWYSGKKNCYIYIKVISPLTLVLKSKFDAHLLPQQQSSWPWFYLSRNSFAPSLLSFAAPFIYRIIISIFQQNKKEKKNLFCTCF